MNWIKKLFRARVDAKDDLFSQRIMEALGGVREKTQEFATAVTDYAMEQEMAELRERISKLEAIILPMRNGAPIKH